MSREETHQLLTTAPRGGSRGQNQQPGLNCLHSLCKDCVTTELSQEIFLCLPPPNSPSKFSPNSRLSGMLLSTKVQTGSVWVSTPLVSSTLHGLFVLEVSVLDPLFPNPPGFVRFSASLLFSISCCVHLHLSAQPYRLVTLEHHSAGHFLCDKGSEAFCQEKKILFENSTTETIPHSWPTHRIADSRLSHP